jgi:hypothetical protein
MVNGNAEQQNVEVRGFCVAVNAAFHDVNAAARFQVDAQVFHVFLLNE